MVFSQMLSYTIYIIATRKHLPQEGKKNQRFQREAYNDARNHFLQKFFASSSSSSSTSSSTTSIASAASVPIIIPSSEIPYSSSSSSSSSLLTAATIACSEFRLKVQPIGHNFL